VNPTTRTNERGAEFLIEPAADGTDALPTNRLFLPVVTR
jgi:hypothetical protein